MRPQCPDLKDCENSQRRCGETKPREAEEGTDLTPEGIRVRELNHLFLVSVGCTTLATASYLKVSGQIQNFMWAVLLTLKLSDRSPTTLADCWCWIMQHRVTNTLASSQGAKRGMRLPVIIPLDHEHPAMTVERTVW